MRRGVRVRGGGVEHELVSPWEAPPPSGRVLPPREAVGWVAAWLDDARSHEALSRLFVERRHPFAHGLDALTRRHLLATFVSEQLSFGALQVVELPPPPPLPANPAAKADKAAQEEPAPSPDEPLGWFELTVVDAWGKPVSGVELEFSHQGKKQKLTTPGSGKVRLPDVASSFGSARLVDPKAVRDVLRPRWKDKVQPTDLPPDLENPEKLGLDAIELVTSLESLTPKTLVLVKPLTRIRLVGMHFDTNKCFLKPSAMPGIRQVAGVYQRNPNGKLLVLGHTDTTADEAYNLDLSVERAEAVRAYFKDDVAAWEAWYGEGKPAQKRWGSREDAQMIAALPCEQTTAGFQQWSNDTRGTALEVDGLAGPKTREALIEAYMALDGTTLPASIEAVVHGCGEYFPRTDEGDQFGADGVAAAENRRVEMYCFDEEIAPPVPGKKATKGEPEYEQWKKQVTRTIDFGAEGDEEVGKIWMELWVKSGDKPLAGVAYTITGERDYQGTTDGEGRLLHDLVPHGDYRIRVEGRDEDSAALVLPKNDDEPQIRFLV